MCKTPSTNHVTCKRSESAKVNKPVRAEHFQRKCSPEEGGGVHPKFLFKSLNHPALSRQHTAFVTSCSYVSSGPGECTSNV